MKSIRQILTKSRDREAEAKTVTGTIIIILSGLVLYADKIIDYWNLGIDYEFQYYGNLEVFVWTMGNTLSPILLVLGYWLKPHKWALAAPLTAYCVQLSYVFRDEKWIQRDYFWHHTVAFVIAFFLLALLLRDLAREKSKLKGIVVYLMELIAHKSVDKDLVKDVEKWDEEITDPALRKLNEPR